MSDLLKIFLAIQGAVIALLLVIVVHMGGQVHSLRQDVLRGELVQSEANKNIHMIAEILESMND